MKTHVYKIKYKKEITKQQEFLRVTFNKSTLIEKKKTQTHRYSHSSKQPHTDTKGRKKKSTLTHNRFKLLN